MRYVQKIKSFGSLFRKNQKKFEILISNKKNLKIKICMSRNDHFCVKLNNIKFLHFHYVE
jgi:hypothetical protein